MVPLVLVAIIGATPIVREFCRLACEGSASGASSHARHGDAAMSHHEMAGHDMGGSQATTAGSTHPDHAEVAPAVDQEHPRVDCCSPAVRPRRDCCDDPEPQVTSIVAAKQLVDPPAVMPQVISSVARSQSVSRFPFETSARPTVPLALRTPLRV